MTRNRNLVGERKIVSNVAGFGRKVEGKEQGQSEKEETEVSGDIRRGDGNEQKDTYIEIGERGERSRRGRRCHFGSKGTE